ncbi:hypothetical protein BJV78DRAFT_1288419 [Lactifluus subvellereus]|nr:hypothetical protein BJV78DRAFT_1288418 [Lactifluus subvellereus]KAI0245262.1 hypothetical protein BJV78DRAFT_1288419 [Lactifluus subvellereus]
MTFVKTIIALSLAILAVAVPQPQAGVDGDMLSNQIRAALPPKAPALPVA